MMGSVVVWKMALANLRKHWKQTLLTAAAGAIGAMLIAISIVNYDSIEHSSKTWIENRLGPINWKLTPADSDRHLFTSEQVKVIRGHTDIAGEQYYILPYISTEASVMSAKTPNNYEQAVTSLLLMGFSMEEAASFDGDRAALWNNGLEDDELILDIETAKLLEVKQGDVVKLLTKNGDNLLRVREITETTGLTGYQEGGNYKGSVIVTEQTARIMADIKDDGYPHILVTSFDPDISLNAMFLLPEIDYTVTYIKNDFINKANKMKFTMLIGLISSIAVISSLLFMRQVLIMIGESRKGIYGLLRAIGLTRGQITSMFMVEAVLLSLLSSIVGTIAGLAGGMALVDWVYGAYAEQLARMTGESMKISAYITMRSAVVLFVAIVAFMLAVSLFAARKAAQINIVEALKGKISNTRPRKIINKFMIWLFFAAGAYLTGMHIYDSLIDTKEITSDNMLFLFISWIISCIFMLYLSYILVGKAAKPLSSLLALLRVPALSILLAVKYPRQYSGRAFTISLLFALVMMTITFTLTLTAVNVSFTSVDRTNQTVFGYGSYASYRSDDEREKIKAAAINDPTISMYVEKTLVVEPFMINFLENRGAQAVIPVTDGLAGKNGFKLIDRAKQFSSDEEAWNAVRSNPEYIILPLYYMSRGGAYDAEFMPVHVGQKLKLPVYEGKMRMMNEKWQAVDEIEFIVAGFTDDESKMNLNDVYAATFVHETIAERLQPYGNKWPNQQGFVLFDFNYSDVKLSQLLEQQFVINDISTFKVPYLIHLSDELVTKQFGTGFVGFTIFSALIGLMGLAVIQYRAVQERIKHIAMMRCIGVPDKQIYWIFVAEGFTVSLIGLLIGTAVGFSGSHLVIQAVTGTLQSHEAPLGVYYAYPIIIPVLVVLALLSLILNAAPARAAVQIKAAEALRINED